MIDPAIPIACNLSHLNDDQRRREQELLRRFRLQWRPDGETDDGIWFSRPADPEALAEVGELMGLERLCCPFLEFRLEVSRAETFRLLISGSSGARDFVRMEFTEEKP